MQLHERRGATTQFGALEGKQSFCEVEGQLQEIMLGVTGVVWNLK
jgi:hypothetical protein